MKRIVCLLLAVLLLTGCAANRSPAPSEDTQETIRITMTLPVAEGADFTGLAEVQKAVNAIAAKEIGVEVDFLLISASSSAVENPNYILQGKPIDLMLINEEDIRTYVGKELLLPMNDLLEQYGQGILELSWQGSPLEVYASQGREVWGLRIPDNEGGICGGLWISPQTLEAVGFAYDPQKIYSLAELDALFAEMKARHPDCYPLGQITSTYSFSTASFFLGLYADGLSSSDPAALDAAPGAAEVINRYEMPAYREWLQYMRKWYLAGYIYPDSAITEATSIGLYMAGLVESIPLVGDPGLLTGDFMGGEIVPLRLSPIRHGFPSSIGVFWTIPKSSADPQAAMKFLNLMDTDPRIANLLSWGIEGRDYALDETGRLHRLPECAYCSVLGVYGDQRVCYSALDSALRQAKAEFSAQSIPMHFEFSGFDFDTSKITQELLAIRQVEQRYVKLLEAGCVDLDAVYPQFLKDLNTAGLGTIIEEKQRQFDAWRSAQEAQDVR